MRTFAGHRGFTSIFSCPILVFIFLAIPPLAMGQDISITDFRIPTSSYQRFLGGLSGSSGKSENDVNAPNNFNQQSNSQQSTSLNLSGNYILGDFSEDRSLEIGLYFNGQGSYRENNNVWQRSADSGSSSGSDRNYQIRIEPTVRYSNYLTPDEWHWFVEGSGYWFFNQSYSHTDRISTSDIYHSKDSYKINQWNASVGGGLGYGKMRDGSPVFAVLRILDKLQEDSVLTRSLKKDEILGLVDILARRTEYATLQDRYVKFLMEDLFRELQKMGVLRNNAPTAYSGERAVEVLSEQIEPRLFGWRMRLGVLRSYDERLYTLDDHGVYSFHNWIFHEFVRLAADYGYPVSLNLHFVSGIAIDVPRIDYQRKMNLSLSAKGIYQIGERVDATISGSIQRSQSVIADWVSNDQENHFYRTIEYDIGVGFRFF